MASLSTYINPDTYQKGLVSKNNIKKIYEEDSDTIFYKYDLMDNGLPLNQYILENDTWEKSHVYKYY